MSENTRLADIVDAVAALEKAIIADTGITSEACTCTLKMRLKDWRGVL